MAQFYPGLLPWDIDRLTVQQFNAFMTHRNAVVKAAEKS